VKNSIGDMMKQAQQMQESMQKAQAELGNVELEGQAGAGMVKVVMTGRYDVRRVTIDDMVIGEDKEVLEDLLAAAVNDAVKKVEAHSQQAMASFAGGLDLPAGFKMPFQD
jgi:DNA-binding YbaB/EbfC family protein